MCDSSVIVKHSRSDMKEIRETIVVENEMCGFENPNLVNVESDARYNNPIYSSTLSHSLLQHPLLNLQCNVHYGGDISPQYLYFAALMPHCRVYYLGIQKLFFYF
jgi:hypothetical protein